MFENSNIRNLNKTPKINRNFKKIYFFPKYPDQKLCLLSKNTTIIYLCIYVENTFHSLFSIHYSQNQLCHINTFFITLSFVRSCDHTRNFEQNVLCLFLIFSKKIILYILTFLFFLAFMNYSKHSSIQTIMMMNLLNNCQRKYYYVYFHIWMWFHYADVHK